MKNICSLLLVIIAGLAQAQTTWYEIPTGTDKKLNAISFPSNSVGYIGGNDSLLLKTTDNGETWNEVIYSGITFMPGEEHIINLKFVSDNIGYCTVGPYTGVYKTLDGGLTWTQVTPAGNLCFNEGLFFFDENNGFLGGSGCFEGELIEKMTSGTLSNTTLNENGLTSDERIVDIDFLDADFGMAASSGGRIFRTTDAGLTWDSIPSGQTAGIPLTGISIVNDTLAYASYANLGSGFGILRSVDAGLSWSEDVNSATFYYPAYFCVHNSGNGYVYSGAQPSFGTTGLIFESPAANSWNYYDVDHTINDITSYSDSVIFAVGDSGYVVTNMMPSTLGITGSKTESTDFSVYPNPASEFIELHFTAVEMTETITVKFTDISGRSFQVITPANQKVDISNLPAGIYLISLNSETKVYAPQKFIRQ